MSKRRNRTTPIPKLQPKPMRKYTLPMPENHNWTAPEGYVIFVADRGLVRFNIPESWVVHSIEPIEIRDTEPPDEKCRLMATIMRAPPGIDWTGLPLTPLLENATKGTYRKILEHKPIQTYPRDDIEVVWKQIKFDDPVEHRPAFSRIAVARGSAVHVLFTFDYWEDDAERFVPVWEEVMRSLLLERFIDNMLKGETLH